MRAIRQKNTSPEIKIRKLLFAEGFRFRINVKTLPGSPDIVLAKFKVAIFVHGCFWHGHGCHLFKTPATRTDFWMAKIQRNRDRDYCALMNLLDLEWRVLTIWECALKGRKKRSDAEIIDQIAPWIMLSNAENQELIIRHG